MVHAVLSSIPSLSVSVPLPHPLTPFIPTNVLEQIGQPLCKEEEISLLDRNKQRDTEWGE